MLIGIPANKTLDEAAVSERFREILPIGTPEPLLAQKVKSLGIGQDNLSSYSLIRDPNAAVVRIEYDVRTLGLVKESWVILLHLDASQKLTSIEARRDLTGL